MLLSQGKLHKDKLQYVEKNNSFLIIIIGVINKFLVVPNICALKVIASLDIRVVIKYISDLIELGINYTFDQIRQFSKLAFKKLIKERITQNAFKYLRDLQGSYTKGRDIQYSELKLQDYLK